MVAGTRITIWIAVLLTLVACSKESADVQLPDKEAKSVTVHLTLSMRSTSGSEPNEGVGHENFIAADDVEALLYEENTKDGTYNFRSRAFMAGVTNISDGKYTLTGVFDRLTTADEGKNFRLVVLANLRGACKATFPYDLIDGKTSTLKDLYDNLIYNYPVGSQILFTSNILTGKDDSGRIPMWGVGELTVPGDKKSESEASVTVYMLRAMAKIEVRLGDTAAGEYTLTRVSLEHCNTRGMLTPKEAEIRTTTPSETENKDLHLPGDPGTMEVEPLYFYRNLNDSGMQTGVYTLYCPELAAYEPQNENVSATSAAHMHVELTSKDNNHKEEYALFFGKKKDESNKLTPFPVLRNHWYVFNVTEVKGGDLTYNVTGWREQEGEIEFN